MPEPDSSQWLFTPEELLQTPSIMDGFSVESEREGRAKGVNFITQVGIMLKLPQYTLATASVFLHRFFVRHSMSEKHGGVHYYTIAATSLYLATKVEENVRAMKPLVIACCRIAQKNPVLEIDEQSKEYWKWRDAILTNEDMLLEALCFDLSVRPPYIDLYDQLVALKQKDNKKVRNVSWAFISDSCLTTMCLRYTPAEISAAAVYFAARSCGVKYPDGEGGRPWWDEMGVSLRDIRRACNDMADFYENTVLRRTSENEYARTPEAGEELLDHEEMVAEAKAQETRQTREKREGSVGSEDSQDSEASELKVARVLREGSIDGEGTREKLPLLDGRGAANGTLTPKRKPAWERSSFENPPSSPPAKRQRTAGAEAVAEAAVATKEVEEVVQGKRSGSRQRGDAAEEGEEEGEVVD